MPNRKSIFQPGILFLFLLITRVASAQIISTIAGGDPPSPQLPCPSSAVLDNYGYLYFSASCQHRVFKMDAAGAITLVAGTGVAGFSGDGGAATNAELNNPGSLRIANGSIYVVDAVNRRVRVISNGIISTVAGNGVSGTPVDGAVAMNSPLLMPSDIAVDSAGTVYIKDLGEVRRVSGGFITTVISNLSPGGMAVDSSGRLYVTDYFSNRIAMLSGGILTTVAGRGPGGFSGDGGPATSAQLASPSGVAVDGNGNLYIADAGNYRIRKVSGGIITTIAGTGTYGFEGDGGAALNAQVVASSITIDKGGNLYITAGGRIRMITGPRQFVPVSPCRIMDTRGSGYTGAFGPPSLAAASARNVPIRSSGCNIPPTAQAYALNMTVIPKAGFLAFLTAWPAGQSQPLVSTMNSWDGSVLANAAIVPAGTDGDISVFASDSADLVLDINGYFVPPEANSLQFFPVNPCRLLDTRGGPFLSGGTEGMLQATQATCGVPASARAFALNVTVVPKVPLLYLTTWPTGQQQPYTSLLNSWDGAVLANAAIVPAGTNGFVSFFSPNNTDLVVDINGYFAPPGTGGLNFYPLPPCRVTDTRNAAGPFGGPSIGAGQARAFALQEGTCGVPVAAGAYSLNMTVVPAGPLSYLTTWPTGAIQPLVSTLNAFKGLAVANAAIVPAGTNGAVSAYLSNAGDIVIDVNGFFAQ